MQAEHFHQLIMESVMPATAVVVAAPMRNLWPADCYELATPPTCNVPPTLIHKKISWVVTSHC